MFSHYLKIALRYHRKQKIFSSINIFGLSIGLACTIIILIWIFDQYSYDRFVKDKNNIYRLEALDWVGLPGFFDDYLIHFPEIEHMVRIVDDRKPVVSINQQFYEIEDFVFTDTPIFYLFNLNFIHGNPYTSFSSPFSIVLTDKTSRKLFGNGNPIGQTLTYNNEFTYTITGVINDPAKFHKPIDLIASIQDLPIIHDNHNYINEDRWNYLFYLLLNEDADLKSLQERINEVLKNELPAFLNEEDRFLLRAFNTIYFSTGLQHEGKVNHGNLKLIILFASIAIAILIIACINFINLTTAKSYIRKKEIAVRKIVGASRGALIFQFLFETLISIFLSVLLALILAVLFLSPFNRLIGENLVIDYFSPVLAGGILLIFFFTGIVSGVFPSLYLASGSPLSAFRGDNTTTLKHSGFRNILTIIQFVISIVLICGTVVVMKQIKFMRSKELGFQPDQIVHINLKGDLLHEKKEVFRDLLLNEENINEVSVSDDIPGNIRNTNTWTVDGEEKSILVINADPEFVQLFDIQMVQGRNFSRETKTDYQRKLLINEEAVRFFGFDKPVGMHVRANYGDCEIIGVVKDFHFNSLHYKISPMAICWDQTWTDIANIKVTGNDMNYTLQRIKDIWQEFSPESLFSYHFVKDSYTDQYSKEDNLAETLLYFTFLAILIACLGILGLSIFISEKKTKEIAVRKVFGSKSSSIIFLLFKTFFRWITFSFFISVPIAYLLLNDWLQNFAYKTGLSLWTFLLSGLITIIIVLSTTAVIVIKAADRNPIESLRYE